jgi:uncharacterized protein DUF4232
MVRRNDHRPGEGGRDLMTAASRSRTFRAGTMAAFVLAATFLAGPAAGSSSAAPQCSTAQLRLKFIDTQAAAGRRYIDYAFKNAGARQCSLRGYPTVVLLDKQGHVIHSAHAKVGHSPISPIRTVVTVPISARSSHLYLATAGSARAERLRSMTCECRPRTTQPAFGGTSAGLWRATASRG